MGSKKLEKKKKGFIWGCLVIGEGKYMNKGGVLDGGVEVVYVEMFVE